MGRWVYIERGIVMDRTQLNPYKVFFPEYACKFIKAPLEVDSFWRYENGKFLPPLPPDEKPTEDKVEQPETEDLLDTIRELKERLASLESK